MVQELLQIYHQAFKHTVDDEHDARRRHLCVFGTHLASKCHTANGASCAVSIQFIGMEARRLYAHSH